MRLLVDTHLLIWSLTHSSRLSPKARTLLEDPQNDLVFSVVSLWETGVKRALNRSDFVIDAHVLRGELLVGGYRELGVSGEHALAVSQLPALHKDPFDRLLLCQALVEGLTLVTNDSELMQYPVSVLFV